MTAVPARAGLLCNPLSGTLATLPDATSALRSAIAAAGFELTAPPPAGAALPRQWEAAVEGGATVVFVAGGDGTISAAAAMSMRQDIPLALLPGGTMNRVCRQLGLTGDPVASIARYRAGREARLDVGLVGEEVFLFQSLIGAPVRLLRFREMQRGQGIGGWLPLLRAALRRLLSPRQPSVVLKVPQQPRLRGSAAVIAVPAPPGQGRFTLDVTRHAGVLGRLRQAIAWFRGAISADRSSVTIETSSLVAHGSGALMRFSVDGEMRLSPPPLRYRLRPAALRVLLPGPPA